MSRTWAALSRRSSPATSRREIQEAAVRQQQTIESGERVVVGVNKFRSAEEPAPVIFRVNTEVARSQVERLNRVRATRDAAEAETSLEAPQRRRRVGREPDAGDSRRGACLRHARRDLRRTTPDLGRIPPTHRGVTPRAFALPVERPVRPGLKTWPSGLRRSLVDAAMVLLLQPKLIGYSPAVGNGCLVASEARRRRRCPKSG